jgi:hypothetical protein
MRHAAIIKIHILHCAQGKTPMTPGVKWVLSQRPSQHLQVSLHPRHLQLAFEWNLNQGIFYSVTQHLLSDSISSELSLLFAD